MTLLSIKMFNYFSDHSSPCSSMPMSLARQHWTINEAHWRLWMTQLTRTLTPSLWTLKQSHSYRNLSFFQISDGLNAVPRRFSCLHHLVAAQRCPQGRHCVRLLPPLFLTWLLSPWSQIEVFVALCNVVLILVISAPKHWRQGGGLPEALLSLCERLFWLDMCIFKLRHLQDFSLYRQTGTHRFTYAGDNLRLWVAIHMRKRHILLMTPCQHRLPVFMWHTIKVQMNISSHSS